MAIWENLSSFVAEGAADVQMVNNVIRQMKSDGSLRKLHEKYGLIYMTLYLL